MPIFEYKCRKCSSVFEHIFSKEDKLFCLFCGSVDVVRSNTVIFGPKKEYCPKEESVSCEDCIS
ncbi:MAG: hypothetical protein GF353_21365 [Candidatus Lokiarchaeota archaeon]|nr:hypothetical protein [Candidatus Lokiarchaeota archaeon]